MALSSGGPKGCRFFFGRSPAGPFEAPADDHETEKRTVRGKTREDLDLIEMLDSDDRVALIGLLGRGFDAEAMNILRHR